MVIDLKTGKYPPPDKELPENPQLGLYQHAVAHGAVDDLLPDGPGPAPGGAELVQLRREARASVKVQTQEPQQPDEDGHSTVERQLMEAVTRGALGDPSRPRPASTATTAQFHAICPIKGSGTVLS